jgi:hypothetical protein
MEFQGWSEKIINEINGMPIPSVLEGSLMKSMG